MAIPTDIAGLRLWLDASTLPAGSLASWADTSGLGNNVLQGATGRRPSVVANAMNGRPVVRFDGVDDQLDGTSIFSAAPAGLTVFAVLATAQATTRVALSFGNSGNVWMGTHTNGWMWNTNNGNFLNTGNSTTGAPYLLCGTHNGTAGSLYLNGVLALTQNLGLATPLTGGFRVGGYLAGGFNFPGDVAELLVYGTVLTTGDRQAIEAYLTAKWITPTPSLTLITPWW